MSIVSDITNSQPVRTVGTFLDLTASPASAYAVCHYGFITLNPIGAAAFVFTQRAVLKVVEPIFAKYFEGADKSTATILLGRTLSLLTSVGIASLATAATGTISTASLAANTVALTILGLSYLFIRTALTLDNPHEPLKDVWITAVGGLAVCAYVALFVLATSYDNPDRR